MHTSGMQVLNSEIVVKFTSGARSAGEASNTSGASTYSWGFGGAVSPPMGPRSEAPENFWVFGAIMSSFELFWEDI